MIMEIGIWLYVIVAISYIFLLVIVIATKQLSGCRKLVILLVMGFVNYLAIEIAYREKVGIPMPFNELKQNRVYEVVKILPEDCLMIIKNSRNQRERRIVEIPTDFDKKIERGDTIIKIGSLITKKP